jgi:hypothetical protein
MKRATITIDEKGNYDIDLGEGFAGTSCVEKANQIQVMIGGETKEQKEKDAYYEQEDVNFNEIFTRN